MGAGFENDAAMSHSGLNDILFNLAITGSLNAAYWRFALVVARTSCLAGNGA